MLSLSIAVWSISLFGVISSNSFNNAWFWQNVLDFSGIFIPLFNFSLILQLFKYEKYNKNILKLYWALGILLAAFSFTSFYKVGLVPKADFRFWVDPGLLYFAFPLFYLFLVVYSIRILIDVAKNNTGNKVIKSQAMYFLMASLLGFGGGATNFFPQFFNIYPFGNYLVILYVCFIGYSIVKHGLFNIKVIATQLLTFAIWIAMTTQILLAETVQARITQGAILLFMIGFGILLIRSVQKEVRDREDKEKLAEQLAVANVRLRALDQAKSDFITIASHQLRAPLTAIKGYSSLLLEGSYGSFPDKLKDPLNKVFASASHMVVLIDDFLNLSRIERGKMEFTFDKADFKQIIKDLFDELVIINSKSKKKLALSLEIEPGEKFDLMMDGLKVRQVASNMLDNSVKYTDKGEVKVSLYKNKEKNSVIFKIKDTGVGMTQETQAHIFQKFVRASGAANLHAEGTGLGLYVAKKIMDVHQGRVWGESEGMGKGSTFYMELPLNFTPPAKIEIQDDALQVETAKGPVVLK